MFFLLSGCASKHTVGKKATYTKETVLQLNPGVNNPRNSEGDFIHLKNGRILFIYSHYTGSSSSDHAAAFLASRYSDDNGKTWSASDKVEVMQDGKMNVMSVSLLRLQNGQIALFYLKKNSIEDCLPMVRFSSNEAESWSEPVPCIRDKKGYFVLNNNRVIQLANGRILLAVALHQTPDNHIWNNSGTLFAYYSDDNGRSWTSGIEVPNPNKIITQEPGIIELKNGNIWMLIRTDKGVQYQSISKDNGVNWTSVEPTKIASPLSPAAVKRIPLTNDLLMVWNNNNGQVPEIKAKRTPLCLAISKDEGQTWQNIKIIESDVDGWYCYTAIDFAEKNILLGYCAGSQSQKTQLAKTAISIVNLDWLYKK